MPSLFKWSDLNLVERSKKVSLRVRNLDKVAQSWLQEVFKKRQREVGRRTIEKSFHVKIRSSLNIHIVLKIFLLLENSSLRISYHYVSTTRSHEWPFTTEIDVPPLSNKNIFITLTKTNSSRFGTIIRAIVTYLRDYKFSISSLTKHDTIITSCYTGREALTKKLSVTNCPKSVAKSSSGRMSRKSGTIDFKTLGTGHCTLEFVIRLLARIDRNN